MTQTQLIKTMELIEQKFEDLTIEKFEEFSAGNGLYTLLEESVDESFGIDTNGRDDFWKHINSVHGKNERPDLANLSFQILDKYYFAVFNKWYQRNIANITIGNLKKVMGNVQYVSVHTYNIDQQQAICVFKGWIDQISDSRDNQDIEYLRTQIRPDGFSELLIGIGNTNYTEVNF